MDETLADVLWKYFRYIKFVFMLIGMWIGLGIYTGCEWKQVPRQNEQMSPTYKPDLLLTLDPKVNSRADGLISGDPVVYNWLESRASSNQERLFMGRVMAFGGQTIEARKGEIFIDGKVLPESGYLRKGEAEPFNLAEMIIPAGYVFILVDNRVAWRKMGFRTEGRDSRHFGPVPERSIRGRITSTAQLKQD